MSYVAIPGASPLWVPFLARGTFSGGVWALSDTALLDADLEEYQMIGSVTIDGGGSKTFGTSGSKIGWLPGASITFSTGSTLRVGVKKASSISTSAGPPARATAGAAAFDVYKDLVGGTDTITSTTWRTDTMASGTPFTVTDGDLLAISWHLAVTSGTPSVKVRVVGNADASLAVFPAFTLITSSAGTFTAQSHVANAMLTFDDGTFGWISPSQVRSVVDAATSNIGNTNIIGNIINLPFNCKIDALGAIVNATSTADFSLCLYSTPLGTPSLVEAISFDANIQGTSSGSVARLAVRRLTTVRELVRNTDYAIGIRQDTANAVTGHQYDVDATTDFKANGLGAGVYAANSTAAATFAAQNSGKRRYQIAARISHLDDGAGGGGGGVIARSLIAGGS